MALNEIFVYYNEVVPFILNKLPTWSRSLVFLKKLRTSAEELRI